MADRTAIVLLSGGLDSATVAALARSAGYRIVALTFRYGQRHAGEIDAARRVAAATAVDEHVLIDIDLRVFGGSALTAEIAVPKAGAARATDADADAAAQTTGPIPITYVPARNTIFLSYALALAEVRGSADIFIGANAVDYSGYPDCRPAYIAAFERMANLATRAGVEGAGIRIHAPLMQLRKEDIIRRGLELGVDYALTRSCYDPPPDGTACGACDACRIRRAAFERLGLPDPA